LFEGFGIPVIEALFCKTPVITTRGGCFSESGGPSTVYVDPIDSNEISEAIKLIQGDDNLRETMISDGWNYAQRFTDENVAENLMEVYTSL
jgi:glycosyltransferase involved in cell wall biosynthesis